MTAAQIGATSLLVARHRLSGSGAGGTMNWRRRLAALFVVLALAGCAQGTTGQAGAPNAPYPPENNGR